MARFVLIWPLDICGTVLTIGFSDLLNHIPKVLCLIDDWSDDLSYESVLLLEQGVKYDKRKPRCALYKWQDMP